MALDPRGMGEAIVRNLPARTGRSLQQWLDLLAQDGPADAREQVAWLQRTHGLGRVTAQVVVGHAGGRDVLDVAAYDAPDTLVAGLFGPPGSALRLRYEALRAEIEAAVPGARARPTPGTPPPTRTPPADPRSRHPRPTRPNRATKSAPRRHSVSRIRRNPQTT